MTPEQWIKLTPSHQAELWPGLSNNERAAILTADLGVMKRVASATAEILQTEARNAEMTRYSLPSQPQRPAPPAALPKKQISKPTSATFCHFFAVLGFVAGLVFVGLMLLDRNNPAIAYAYFAAITIASSVVWWALGDIVVSVHRTANNSER